MFKYYKQSNIVTCEYKNKGLYIKSHILIAHFWNRYNLFLIMTFRKFILTIFRINFRKVEYRYSLSAKTPQSLIANVRPITIQTSYQCHPFSLLRAQSSSRPCLARVVKKPYRHVWESRLITTSIPTAIEWGSQLPVVSRY